MIVAVALRTVHAMRPFAALLLFAALPAYAQSPPIKPGLWQMERMENSRDGKPAEDPTARMAEAMKKMSPEQRKQMEALMKQRGVDTGGAGGTKICLDRASLDQGRWQPGEQGRCKVDFTSRTSAAWAWKTTCVEPPSTGEGEARFESGDRYTVTYRQTSTTAAGQPRSSEHRMTMRRIGDDCGDVKPLQPAAKSKP